MMTNLDGDGPLYLQVTRGLKEALRSGLLKGGQRLPSTREFAHQWGIGRNSVKAAYEQLVAEGCAIARPGSGTYLLPTSEPAMSQRDYRSAPPPSRFAGRAREATRDAAQILPRGTRYDFQFGNPMHSPALLDLWKRSVAHALALTPISYPPPAGLPGLRQAIAEYLRRRRGIACVSDDVLIVSGTQQALALTASVLINDGDQVAVEDPSYFAIRQVLASAGATLHYVGSDDHGMQVSQLPGTSPRLVALCPANQFPSGAVLSGQRRQQLVEYAKRHDCYVFEDDYDSELRFGARPVPALKATGDGQRVIYSGTFSKIMFPSLRLGYMVVPSNLRRDFVTAKYLADMGNPSLEQAAMAHFMEQGRFEQHIRRTVRALTARREALLEGLLALPRSPFSVCLNGTGTYVLAWLVGYSAEQTKALISHALGFGLGLFPAAHHYKLTAPAQGLLFGLAGMSATEIRAAVEQLDACLADARAHSMVP